MRKTLALLLILLLCLMFTGCDMLNQPVGEETVSDTVAENAEGNTDGEKEESLESADSEEDNAEDGEEKEPEMVSDTIEEDEEEEPETVSDTTAGEDTEEEEINNMFRQATYDIKTDGAIGIIYNEPTGGLLYGISISDEFGITAQDHVLIIPKYEHTKIQLYSLKTVTNKQGKTTQKKDKLIYEVEDSALNTVLYTSVPRIEDAPQYGLIMEYNGQQVVYKFKFYSPAPPEYELLK